MTQAQRVLHDHSVAHGLFVDEDDLVTRATEAGAKVRFLKRGQVWTFRDGSQLRNEGRLWYATER